jgi:urease accessory protein
MYATLQGDSLLAAPPAPQRQRALGRLVLEATASGGATRVLNLSESGPSRIRLPRTHGGALEAVMMNTGGGIACGDIMHVQVAAKSGSDVVMTTPAAERIYRSDGAVSEVHVRLDVESGARLEWLPQETILYEHARLRRSFEAEVAEDATLSIFEAVMLGRHARGERITHGLLHDRWRIRCVGRLVHCDNLVLGGALDALLHRPAVMRGHTAFATFLHIAPDADSRLEEAREALAGAECACAASAWNGRLAVRFLAPEIAPLRRSATAFLTRFLGRPLPRVWHS